MIISSFAAFFSVSFFSQLDNNVIPINEVINKYANYNNQKYLDKVVEVLIEAKSDKEDKYMGYTDTMKLVNIACDPKYLGQIVNVKITEVKTWSLDGEIVDDSK